MMPVAVITGASSGIGEQFAYQLAATGYHCILIARREAKLQLIVEHIRSKGGEAEYIIADLCSAEQTEKVSQILRSRPVDLLVNNAGVGSYGFYPETNIDHEAAMLQLNIQSVVTLTRAVLPAMIKRRSGGIIQVASVVAFQPTPFMASYSASKTFVLHYSEAIGRELRPLGIHVMALCPGGTATEFVARAQVSGKLQSFFTMSPQEVVSQAIRAFQQKKPVYITGKKNWLMSQFYRILPRGWVTQIAMKIVSSKER